MQLDALEGQQQPAQGRATKGSVTLGVKPIPNGRPWRGQKPIPFAFCFCSYRAQSMRGGLPRVSARFAHLAPGLVAVAPLGRIQPARTSELRGSEVKTF